MKTDGYADAEAINNGSSPCTCINRSTKNLRRLMKESADGGGANAAARSGNPV